MIVPGEISEAARNILLMASQVDLVAAFSVGPVTRAHIYSVSDKRKIVVAGRVGDEPGMDDYQQEGSVLVSKDLIEWKTTSTDPLRDWHHALGLWVEANFPHFFPNEIPSRTIIVFLLSR